MKRWQVRIFTSVWITYFAYYLCRYNMPIAKTQMCETYSWDNEAFGIVLSALTIMYAVGQFVNGQLADRFGARLIASLGVLGSVVMNMAVFAVVMLADPDKVDPQKLLFWTATFWGINGFVQAMGWSPMVRIMTHWFPSSSRGKVMGWVGTCYQLGGAFAWGLAFFLTGYYVQKFNGDWRLVFLVPSVMFAAVGIYFYVSIRNQPEDVNLPPVDEKEEFKSTGVPTNQRTLLSNIMTTLKNPYLWLVAITFFMLDVNRYGFVNWLPAFLDENGGGETSDLIGNFKEVMKRCIHPLAGSAGAVLAGWATDRFFGGRRAPVIAILLAMLGLFSILFPYIDPTNTAMVIIVVAMIGFCTYGPHILMVGHAAQDFGKKGGAAGAAGFIDAMGYIGATLAGWGAGRVIDSYGFGASFVTFGSAAFVGAILISLIWKLDPSKH